MTREMTIATSLGDITIDVFEKDASNTVRYVSRLIDDGVYADTTFFRSTTLGDARRRPFIQGGPYHAPVCGTGDMPRLEMLADFDTTADSGLRHQRGAVSLARDLITTGRAIADLFICLGDYPDLDAGGRPDPDERGFPVFGMVRDGLDIVEAIADRAIGAPTVVERLQGEVLIEPVRIDRITLAPVT